MLQTKTHIRKLCNSAELTIVENSLPPKVDGLGSTELKKFIKLVRKLRDKNRDLYQRQTLNSRKTDRGGTARGLNARTKEKAAVFDTALKTFETRLSDVEAGPKKSKKISQEKPPAGETRKKNVNAAKVARKAPLNNDKKNQPSFVSGFESRGAQDSAHRQQLQQSYSKPIQGHIKSAGKRAQAKRDGR